jgi:hypothetical protein
MIYIVSMSEKIPEYVLQAPPFETTIIVSTIIISFVIISILLLFSGYDTNNQLNDSLAFSRTIDLSMFLLIAIIAIPIFYFVGKEKNISNIKKMLDKTESFVKEPQSIAISLASIVALYATLFITGIPMTNDTKPITITLIESLLWLFLLFILFIELFKRVFDTYLTDTIFTYLRGLLNYNVEVEVKDVEKKNVIVKEKVPEVFHVSNNLYNYEEAQSICKSFDSRLATYDEVEKSYNNGGEFCGYGWSEGQMILFPTQKSTFDKLQLIPGHEKDCGRPGVNGGFMSNPTIQYGVNCFGVKKDGVDPVQKDEIALNKNTADVVMDAKVKYWQEHKDELLVIDSFNKNKWSEAT